MYEVEVKVQADHQDVRASLEERRADFLGVVDQRDTYYSHPDRDFTTTDEALRLRHESGPDMDQTRVTYKGPLVEAESKTRLEIETGVDNGAAMARLLEELGFLSVETVEKRRERFRAGNYLVVLDAVDGLGEFVEVETEADAVAPARDGALELLRDLGLDPDEQIRASYLELLLNAE